MKTNIKFLILILFGALIIASCGDDDDSGSSQTAAEKIAGKDFAITDLSVTLNDTLVWTFDSLDECDKDDFLRFNADGTGTEDYGAIKCDASDPQSEPFTWSLSDNDTKISLDFNDGPDEIETYTILTNDGTTLRLEASESEDLDGDGVIDVTVTKVTLTKK